MQIFRVQVHNYKTNRMIDMKTEFYLRKKNKQPFSRKSKITYISVCVVDISLY